MDRVTLRVDEILGDAFVEAYGLADRYELDDDEIGEPPDPDPDDEGSA